MPQYGHGPVGTARGDVVAVELWTYSWEAVC